MSYLGTLCVLQKFKTQAFVLMRTLNDARKICEHNLSVVNELGVADVRP